MKSLGRLVLCLLLCLGVGLLESVVTRPEIATWYAALAKPPWTPPPFVFPIAWTILYVLMAVSLWRLWDRAAPSAARRSAITWFLIQLALNAAWSPVFFGWHATRAALVVIVALFFAIVMTMIATSRADKPASWLLAPYLAWVAYATTLNAGVVAMN
ncbi:MAG: TspO protein [Afipia sp. 62-7]|nr:tryptophan-rich sensory protein [Afipia sp.]OJU18731.1 MAG: TspO protein [Afipia sp. 62-7]